jgi:hypothetical protein
MRCKSLEGPWGSHHVDARREKWLTSEGDTEDEEEDDMGGEDVVECGLVEIGSPALAKGVGLSDVQQTGARLCRTAREAISHWDLVMFRGSSSRR